MRSFISGVRDRALGVTATTNTERASDPLTAHYDKLERYYLNSGPYDRLSNLSDEGVEVKGTVALRALRNPANRVTEFYAAKLDPTGWQDGAEYGDGAKPKGENITKALRSVREWSNWQAEGRTAARQFAWAGDLFEKVATKHRDVEDPASEAVAVYAERIDPRHVKDFDKDERGFFTYLRVSVPKTRREDDEVKPYTQTEIWDKNEATYRVYEHTDGRGASAGNSVEELGRLVFEQALSATGPNGAPDGFTGYDFIPVVHTKFRDVGKDRGLCAFGHALGMIRECDRIATRLHEMLFPDETWVVTRTGLGPDGLPLPPIELEDSRGIDPLDSVESGKGWARGYDRTTYASGDTVKVGGSSIARLPSGASLEPKIPNRNLAPALQALADQVAALEADIPETAYSKLRELELSGRAIRYSLDDVYSRFNEAFANFAGGIVRLENMALTIGQAVNLPGFSVAEIGEYGESGEGFEHTYPTPDPFPSSRQDEADADKAEAESYAEWKAIGGTPYRKYLEARDYTTEEVDALVAASGESQPPTLAQQLLGNSFNTQ